MSDEKNLTIIWWGQTLAVLFAFFGFLSLTDIGVVCCLSCAALYVILKGWKNQIEERLQLKEITKQPTDKLGCMKTNWIMIMLYPYTEGLILQMMSGELMKRNMEVITKI